MFPTQSKVNRLGQLWLLPVVALALLLVGYLAFTSSTVSAQTPAGDYCIEGIVINWEEKPLAGWQITLTSNISGFVPLTTTSAMEPDDDDNDPDFLKGEFEFTDLLGQAAIYTATIESREGWEGVTPTTISFPINVGEDDCVQIRFKMRRIIPVTVYKIDVNHEGLEDWRIKAVPGPGNLFASPQEEETNISGTAVFTLTPGRWIFTEMPPKMDMDSDDPREAFMPVVPPTGRQELNILDTDEALSIVFKNELVVGCVLVEKVGLTTNPPRTDQPVVIQQNPTIDASYNVAGWGFQLLRKDGTVARQGVTDGKGQLRFDNLPLGPYVLVEEDRPGWTEVSAREFDINVTDNNCEDFPVVFTNEQDDSGFCIEGRKIDANGGYGIADWEIKINPLDKGGFDPDNVFTDGLGNFTINFPRNDYRIPGALYEICEEDKDGWLPHTPTCQKVRLPEWPGACVKLDDFVNQQVGHSESQKMWGGMGMEGGNMGGGSMGGGSMGMSCSSYHVAKKGEGLYDIGKMYNKSASSMLNANPDVANHPHQWVIAGQRICIP
jgi:hypothetical protein